MPPVRESHVVIADATCVAHGFHRPHTLTVDHHHPVPVAWQLWWTPDKEPYPGNDTEGRGHLWDSRTIVVCPNGHRNIHRLIVARVQVIVGALDVVPNLGSRQERLWAEEALARFAAPGGVLKALAEAAETNPSLWGGA